MGETEMRANFRVLQSSYTPKDIQRMINENGVKRMVKEVNKYTDSKKGHNAFLLTQLEGKKILLDVHQTFI